MIFVDEDPEVWAERYKLELSEVPCCRCGKIMKTMLPFVTRKYVGLATEVHECGREYQVTVSVPRSTPLNLELIEALEWLGEL